MSELSTTPVLVCKRCGEMYTVAHLSTASPDVEGKKLHELAVSLSKMGYCSVCMKRRQWYEQQGRLEDFEAGRP